MCIRFVLNFALIYLMLFNLLQNVVKATMHKQALFWLNFLFFILNTKINNVLIVRFVTRLKMKTRSSNILFHRHKQETRAKICQSKKVETKLSKTCWSGVFRMWPDFKGLLKTLGSLQKFELLHFFYYLLYFTCLSSIH